MKRHVRLDDLVSRHPALASVVEEIVQVIEQMSGCFRAGNRVYLCGNGGSAADCEHWSGELLKGFYHKRPLSPEDRSKLPDFLAANLQGALPVIPLTGFLGLSTAFANDVAPELIFAQLIWSLGRPGDLLIGISTSGNARNVNFAMEAAAAKGLGRIGLSGESGGRLKSLTDLCLCVPASETYRIQELHLPVYHVISLILEEEFFGLR